MKVLRIAGRGDRRDLSRWIDLQRSAGKRLPFDQDSIVVAMLKDPQFDVGWIGRMLISPYEPKYIDVIDLDPDMHG